MAILGFHASHEQIGPSRLLEDVVLAEQAGFDAAMCSDHIEPWSARQGHSGFAWSWLGSALARTGLRFGVVSAPGQRYHPAVLAHASATLADMYPGRLWVALGSGENMNEHITGEGWPPKDVRQRRLEECVSVIRRLHSGEEVTHRGLVTVEQARIWDAPAVPPPLIAPAVTIDTARRAAAWADGLVTINQPLEHLRSMLSAYRDAGGRGTLTLQVHLSWASSESEAVAIAMDQWKTNAFAPPIPWDLPTAAYFDAVSKDVGEESVRKSVNVSASTGEHAEWLQQYLELGFDEIYLHFVGQDQRPFIDAFAAKVLPELR
ncbi:TIGR03885 family FMN-dependent LLM class oxidoreductase [Arthrobacter sp. TMN-37]